MAEQVYSLYNSESESSYTFIPHDSPEHDNLLTQDAKLIWQVAAKSWEIACMKKHEYLGWEPYKPMITNAEDLRQFIPQDKHDTENFQLLRNLGYPAIEPVLPELFEWIQDMNWPVAMEIAPFLAGLGTVVLPHVEKIFRSDDSVWKYWVIVSVLGRMGIADRDFFKPVVSKLLENLTQNDRDEEVDQVGAEFLRS